MVFPHLQINFIPQIQIQIFSNPDTSICEKIEPIGPPKKINGFFPQFSVSDQIWALCYELGLCDERGIGTDNIIKKIPSLAKTTLAGQQIINNVSKILDKQQKLILKNLPVSENATITPFVSLNLRTLFSHYFNLTHVQCLNYIQKPEKKEVRIKEIYWIGSSVLKNIGKEAAISLTFEILNGHVPQEMIHRWFSQAPHLIAFFAEEENDLDFRVVFEGTDKNCSKELSLQVVRKIASMIKKQDAKLIEAKYPKISNMPFYLYQDFSWKESYVLNSPLLSKRKIVDEPDLKFSIIALNTETVPIDIIVVGSEEGVLTLKNLNLSSRNCFVIPTRQFMNSQKNQAIEISTQQYGSQAFLDLLFNCFRPSAYNLDGWRFFLRKCIRMGDENDEKKMIDQILLDKEWYLNQKNWKNASLSESEAQFTSAYLYLVLEEYFSKIEADCGRLKDPFFLTGFIFRACQSLINASWISDSVVNELWGYVDQIYWNKNVRTVDAVTINGLIRKALIVENVPFSIVSAEIGLMTWLMNPYSATIHCEKPFFYVLGEFSYLMPIKIGQQCLLLHEYFSSHPIPDSFIDLFLLFGKKYSLSFKKFPLAKYHEELEIDLSEIKKVFEEWLNHSSPILNRMGMMLYLSFYQVIPDSPYFSQMVARLPCLIKDLEDTQKREILNTFDNILTTTSGIQSCLEINYFKSKENQTHEWIEGLIQSRQPFLIEIGYSLWKTNKNFLKEKRWHSFNWNLFHNLVPHWFHHSLSLFQTLQKLFPVTSFQIIDEIHLICSSHLPSHLSTSDLRNLGKLFNQFLDKTDLIDFRDDSQKALFSFDLSQFIQKLFNDQLEDMGEDFLIRSCEKQYLSDHCQQLWMYRINQLIGKKSYQYSAAIFTLAHENKWLLIEKLDSGERDHLMMRLNQALLNENPVLFRAIILKEFNANDAQRANWFFHSLFSYFDKIHFRTLEHDKEILFLLLKTIPSKAIPQTSLLLLECFQECLMDESLLKNHALIHLIDELLIHEKIKEIILYEGPRWKLALLGFLQKTRFFQTQMRVENLWNIYLTTLKIFKVDRTKQLVLYKQLVFLMNASIESSFPVQIGEWIKLKGKNIVEYLYCKKHLHEVQLFLIAVERLNLHSNHLKKDEILKKVWETSRNIANKPSDSLIDYFCSQSFEKNFPHLKEADLSFLRLIAEEHFFSRQFNSDLDALKWLGFCLEHSIIEKKRPKGSFHIQITDRIMSVLESSKYCSEDFLLILNTMQALNIKNGQMWLRLWQKLDNEKIDNQDNLIYLKAWNLFKEVASEKEESFLNCWKSIFQCLAEIKSSELFELLDNQDWQQPFIQDKGIHPLFYSTLTTLFLGVIQLLDPDACDEIIVKNILHQKKKFVHEHSFNKWNQIIEKALLQKLKFAKTPAGVKIFAELITSHSKYFSQTTKEDFYDLVVRLTKSYVSLSEINPKEFKNCDEALRNIFKFIANSNLLSVDEKINLVHLFGLKTHLVKKQIIDSLILVITEKGHQKKIGFLKPFFLSILNETIGQKDFSEEKIGNYFNLAINKFSLSKKENERMYFLKFKSSVDRLSKDENDSAIHAMIALYAQTAPHFISPQESAIQALTLILPFIMNYARGVAEKPENKEIFISHLFRILNIPIKLPREEIPFKSISTSYYWKVLEILNQERELNFEYIDEALTFFLKETIEMVREKKIKPPEAISRIEPIMYFFPTVYLNRSNEDLESYKKHFLNRKQIFAQAYLLNIFSEHRLNLFMLETWLNMKVDSHTFTDQVSTTTCRSIFHLIDLFLINPCKQMSNVLQAMELMIWLIIKMSIDDMDLLISYYEKVFNYFSSFDSFSVQDRILLYSFLCSATDQKLTERIKKVKFLTKLGELYQKIDLVLYNQAIEALNPLMNRSDLGTEQAFYIMWALKKTIESYQFHAEVPKKLKYIKNIQTLMLFVKKAAFQHEFKPLGYSQLRDYDFNKLINLFVVALIEFADFKELTPIYISHAFNDQRREILLEWLRSIKCEENFKKDLVCDALLMTWISIIAKKDGEVFWLPFNDPDTKKEIREIKEFIEIHGDISQKFCFLLVNFLFESKYILPDKFEFFNELDQIIEKLNTVSHLKESLSLFHIVSCFILSFEEPFLKNNKETCGKLFTKFLCSLRACIMKNNYINMNKFQHVITFFIIKSFELNLFDFNDLNHILFIKWTGSYVNFKICEEPLLHLIFLIYEQENRLKNDFNEYADDLEKLFPHVNEYIIETYTYRNFQKVIKLIKEIYNLNNEIGKRLFCTWYQSFDGLLSTYRNDERLLNIIFHLRDDFIKETNCEVKLNKLIIYDNEFKNKKYICSDEKVFKKVFSEYFDEKREFLLSKHEFLNFIDLYYDR